MITANELPLLLLLYVLNSTKPVAGYKSIVVKAELNDEDIVICYDGLDREDNMGPRIEKSTIAYKNIIKIKVIKVKLKKLSIKVYEIKK